MKVNFAWQEFFYGFETKEKAEDFVRKNQGKGWYFIPDELDNYVYQLYDDMWEVRVRKPLRNYPTGW